MTAQSRVSGIALLLAEVLLAGSVVGGLQSCSETRAVSTARSPAEKRFGVQASRIDRVWLGFALDREGRVTPGCAASKFALRDPIHLSMEVTDAAAGAVVRVSVRDLVTDRIAWNEERPVSPGRSSQTFEIGKGLVEGRYRAESTLGGEATNPREFVVHAPREGTL